jgi:hypothetical protein
MTIDPLKPTELRNSLPKDRKLLAVNAQSLRTSSPNRNSLREVNRKMWEKSRDTPTGLFSDRSPRLCCTGDALELKTSDYFYSMIPTLAAPNSDEGQTLLRKKVPAEVLTQEEKIDVKNAIKTGLEICPITPKDNYKKAKLEKLRIITKLEEILPEKKCDILRETIKTLILKIRTAKFILNQLQTNDQKGLKQTLCRSPDIAVDFLNNHKEDHQSYIKDLILEDSGELKKALYHIYQLDPSLESTQELLGLFALKADAIDKRLALIFEKKEFQPVLEKLISYTKLFYPVILKKMSDAEKIEMKKTGNLLFQEQLKNTEKELEHFIQTNFSALEPQKLAQLEREIQKEIAFDEYNIPFFVSSHLQLNGHEISRLNAIATTRKMTNTPEIAFDDLFSSDSIKENPTSSGAFSVDGFFLTANQPMLDELQAKAGQIANHWDKSLLQISIAPYSMQSEVPFEYYSMLNPTLEHEDIQTLIINASWRILCERNYPMFPRLHAFFINERELIVASAEPNGLGNLSFKIIKFVLKEQKKHTFERFRRLHVIYSGFVRDARQAASQAEMLKKGAGKDLIDIIKNLLLLSPYDDHKTVYDNHHKSYVMGYEPKISSEGEKRLQAQQQSLALANINKAFLIPDEYKITHFERSHTFPFPAMMNWKASCIHQSLEEKGYHVTTLPDLPADFEKNMGPDTYRKIRPPISKNGFDRFKQDLAKGKNELFEREIAAIKSTAKSDVANFLYHSLNLLATAYLYSVSETEALPSFVNQELDALSEFKKSSTNSYKIKLRDAVMAMLDTPNQMASEDLSQYLSQAQENLESKKKEWKKKAFENPTESIYYNALIYGALQTEQAILAVQHQDRKVETKTD